MTNKTAMINMIKQQLRTGDVLTSKILNLYEIVPREEFVPLAFRHFAYSDLQIPLAHGQRMLTPLEEGKLLNCLNLQGHETVLEIGTGSGFFTALLSHLCMQIITIEFYVDFTTAAHLKLSEHNCCNNVDLITGDAIQGWLAKAPYDIIIFTTALTTITKTQKMQVLPGGKLFAIMGKNPVMQGLLYQLGDDGQWASAGQLIFETEVPPVIDKFKRQEFVF